MLICYNCLDLSNTFALMPCLRDANRIESTSHVTHTQKVQIADPSTLRSNNPYPNSRKVKLYKHHSKLNMYKNDLILEDPR